MKVLGQDEKGQNRLLVAAGLLAILAGIVLANPLGQTIATVIGLVLIALAVFRAVIPVWTKAQRGAFLQDPLATVITSEDRVISTVNAAALQQFRAEVGQRLDAMLGAVTPTTEAVLLRLQSRAHVQGAALDQVATGRGALRVFVQRLSATSFLWRIDTVQDSTAIGTAQQISLPMFSVDPAGAVVFSNLALQQLLGIRPRHLNDVIADQMLKSGEEISLNGRTGPIRVYLVTLESEDRRDIYLMPLPTAVQIDLNLVADFQTMPVAMMMFEADGTLAAINLAAREMMGINALGQGPKSDLMFQDMFEGLGRPVSDWLSDVAEARMPAGAQVLRLHHQADAFLQVSLRRMVENGRARVIAILQDATALKTLEAQFVQSQKMEAIGQLAGGIAHDFNNLLTAISGHCDLLLTRNSAEDANYPDLIQISQNANRAAGLVGQLLAFSRKQTLQPEYLDIQEVVSDMTHLMNRLVGEKVRLSLYLGAALGTIRADRRQLEQVLMNLVVNARDAMEMKGTIRIETEAVQLQGDLLRDRVTVPAGEYALIRVIDSGSGIHPDRLQKIFEPFYTTKKQGEGTGLGLSTAYGIVKQSGGFIFVDSTLGKGTVFSLYFPIHARPAHEEMIRKAPPKTTVLRQGEGVVLLVEDEAPVRAFAARALRLRGYTVLEAACGEDALDLLKDSDLQIDMFVTDVIMPGLDGPTWVREALTTRPKTPVIFVSGYAEDVMSEQQSRIPNAAFLPKPFSLTDLTMAVQKHLQAAAE